MWHGFHDRFLWVSCLRDLGRSCDPLMSVEGLFFRTGRSAVVYVNVSTTCVPLCPGGAGERVLACASAAFPAQCYLESRWSAGRPTSRARLPASQQRRRISRLRSSTASKPRAALGRPRNVEAFGTARDAGKAAESPGRTLAEAPEARNGPGTSQEGFGTARDAREGPGKPRAGPAGSPGSPQWSREAPENRRISLEGFGTAREGPGMPRAGPAGSSGNPEWPREAAESSGTSRKVILRGQRAQLPQLRYNLSQNSLAGPHNSYNLKIKRRNYYSLL